VVTPIHYITQTKELDVADETMKYAQESSADAEIAQHVNHWMQPKCRTPHCSIPH